METTVPVPPLSSSLTGFAGQNDRSSMAVRLLLVAAAVFAQGVPTTAWAQSSQRQLAVSLERSLGPGWLQAIVALPQGGYVVAGRMGQPKAVPKASVIRLDEKGSVVWEAGFDGKRLALFGGLSLTPTGELVLTGFRGDGADWALSLDPSGKTLSEKSFGRPLALMRGAVMLSNGGWVSIGDDFDAGPPAKLTLFRFEPTGVFVSKRAIPDFALEDAATPLIAPVGPSGLALVRHAATGKKKGRPRVIRFDAVSWQTMWDVTIDLDPDWEPGVSTAVSLPGGSLAISGMIDAHRAGASWWAAVVRADGKIEWLSRSGRFDSVIPFASAALADGGVVVGGCALAKEAKHWMPWLAVVDAKGVAYEDIAPMQDGGAVLALSTLPTGGFAAAGISGNGCAVVEAGTQGANTWVRVMRPSTVEQAR